MENQALIVNMLVNTWHAHVKHASAIFNKHSDEQLMQEIAPGRNRMVYLLGHLAAVHDAMLPLLGISERQYVHLAEPFLKNADGVIEAIPHIAEIRAAWDKTNETLAAHFRNMTADQWLEKHSAVSEEDFAKEPHRNKLNVLISRTNHMGYHTGQIALLKN